MFLRRITVQASSDLPIAALAQGATIELKKPVAFFVGENGSGKSTLLEAIASECDFNLGGGSTNHMYANRAPLKAKLDVVLSWFPRTHKGFFFRSDSHAEFASYLDQLAEDDPTILSAYGGRSLSEQSQGESLLALFRNRIKQGIFLLDEPDGSLSSQNQLALLALLHRQSTAGSQFLIATHSPILISYPHAEIYQFGDSAISKEPSVEGVEQYRLARDFLSSPERFLKELLSAA